MSELVNLILSKGIEKMFEVISYVCKSQGLVYLLKRDYKVLISRHNDVRKKLKYALYQNRDILDEVAVWVEESSKQIKASKDFLEMDRAVAPGCCSHDSNYIRRYEDATESESQYNAIQQLLERGARFDKVYFDQLRPRPMAKIWARGYVALNSRDKIIDELKRFLKVGEKNQKLIIRIYGVEGVGKTVLAKKLAADMESGNTFAKVVFTNGNDQTVKEIQKQISERIGFEFSIDSVTERAAALDAKLTALRNVLIIFDNVDQQIKLEEIGVPEPTEENGCRIVALSRSLPASKNLYSQMNLQIKPLNQAESEILAAKFAKQFSCAEYSLAGISPEKAGLPAEIKRIIFNKTTPATESIIASSWPGAGTSTSSSSGARVNAFLLDADALQIEHVNKPQYWRLNRNKSSTEAELIQVWFLHIEGMATGLLPETDYGAYFVYRLSDSAKGFNINQVDMIVGRTSKRCYLDPSKAIYDSPVQRVDEWLEIEMGRFRSNRYADSPVNLIVQDHDTGVAKSGLRIHGIELRQLSLNNTT